MSMRLNLDQRLGKIGYLMMGVTGGYARTDTPNGTSSDPSALIYNLNPYEQPNGAELVSYPGRSYFDLMNQYSEQSTAKDAGASATLTLNPLAGLDVAAVAGLDFLLGKSSSSLLPLRIRKQPSECRKSNGASTKIQERDYQPLCQRACQLQPGICRKARPDSGGQHGLLPDAVGQCGNYGVWSGNHQFVVGHQPVAFGQPEAGG